MKVGRPGFPTGSYNESGAWDIYAGNRIELTPEHRMNGVAKTDRKLMATVKEDEKAMDEGAGKPLPREVSFTDENTFSTASGFADKPNVYRRVRPEPSHPEAHSYKSPSCRFYRNTEILKPMNGCPNFHTADRVVLRRLSLDDLARFQGYRTDPEVGKYQGWSPFSNEEAANFLSEMNRADPFLSGVWFQLGIADRQTNDLIGDIGVCVAQDEEHAEIGLTLDPGSQGQGLATEAICAAAELLFASTKIERIVGITDARNTPSIRLLERLGMRRVQTVAAIFRDQPCEEHWYELLRR